MNGKNKITKEETLFQIKNKLVYLVAIYTIISFFLSSALILFVYNAYFYVGEELNTPILAAALIGVVVLLHWGVSGFLGLLREVSHN